MTRWCDLPLPCSSAEWFSHKMSTSSVQCWEVSCVAELCFLCHVSPACFVFVTRLLLCQKKSCVHRTIRKKLVSSCSLCARTTSLSRLQIRYFLQRNSAPFLRRQYRPDLSVQVTHAEYRPFAALSRVPRFNLVYHRISHRIGFAVPTLYNTTCFTFW